MRSRFRIAGHPAHPMLVMFPLALLPLLLVLDAVQWYTGDEALWTAGFWVALFGLAMTLLAIIPGAVDMAAIPDATKAHRTALIHAIVGTTMLLAFVGAVWVRWPLGGPADDFALAVGIDAFGTVLAVIQGWLGGELVYRHHIGVRAETEGGEPVPLAPTSERRAGRGDSRRPGI